MRLRPSALLFGLALAVVSFSPAPPQEAPRRTAPADRVAADPEQMANEERDLQKAVRADDATAALDYFRKRTPGEAQRRELRTLIRNLGDESFEVRQKASADLIASGPVAAGLLRSAARSRDSEVAQRAAKCLTQMRRDPIGPLRVSAVKIVALKQPPEVIAILFAYLPFAEDESIAEEIRATLTALTVKDGKAERALVDALESADPEPRAQAGTILARANLADPRPAVRRLLKDENASVRLRVGRALVEAKDKEAIPVLIDLLNELVGDDRWDVEDVLERIAGENAPAVPRSDADDIRRQRRDAWRGWWKSHGGKVDLAHLPAPRSLHSTLLLVSDLSTSDGQVFEVDPNGRAQLQLDSLLGPIAVERVAADRLLIAEYARKRVIERNLEGKTLWEKDLPSPPVAVQRLANGNTFIACRNRLLEIDRDGKEVVNRQRPVRDILGARRHPDGSIALITHDGLCRWLDAAGRETISFPVGGPFVMGVGIDVLPNKSVLVPRFEEGLVTEYDRNGKVLWQATAPGAASAERLPNGHTLVGCTSPSLVVELDRNGRVVWQHQPERSLIQATRR
jgi:HEAT repeat protein